MLNKCGLACSVLPHYRHEFTFMNGQRHVIQGPIDARITEGDTLDLDDRVNPLLSCVQIEIWVDCFSVYIPPLYVVPQLLYEHCRVKRRSVQEYTLAFEPIIQFDDSGYANSYETRRLVGKDLLRRALISDPAIGEYDDPVNVLRSQIDTMLYEENSHLIFLVQSIQDPEDTLCTQGIEERGGLIEYENLGLHS